MLRCLLNYICIVWLKLFAHCNKEDNCCNASIPLITSIALQYLLYELGGIRALDNVGGRYWCIEIIYSLMQTLHFHCQDQAWCCYTSGLFCCAHTMLSNFFACDIFQYKDFTVYTIARNPWDRLVSVYREKCEKQPKCECYLYPLNDIHFEGMKW